MYIYFFLEPTKAPPSGNNITTTVQPTPNKTTTVPPTPKSTTTPIPIITTTTEPPTTSTPNVTTTVKPSSTTLSPNSTTTLSPNVTTAIPSTTTEPSPAPSPARSWDGPSFLGMIGINLYFKNIKVIFYNMFLFINFRWHGPSFWYCCSRICWIPILLLGTWRCLPYFVNIDNLIKL